MAAAIHSLCAGAAPALAGNMVLLRDVQFARVGTEQVPLTADVWRTFGTTRGGRPVAVLVHGGGWRAGDKREWEQQRWVQRLAERGWVVINLNYRLACTQWPAPDPDADPAIGPTAKSVRPSDFRLCRSGMSDSLQDVRAGLQFAARAARRWNGDARRMVVIGASAGAHLALLASSARTRPVGIRAVVAISPPPDLEWLGEHPEVKLNQAVRQAIGCGYDACAATWRAFSPRAAVRRGATPPTYVFNAAADVVTDPYPAARYVSTLRGSRITASYVTSADPASRCHGPYTCDRVTLRGTGYRLFDHFHAWLGHAAPAVVPR